MPTPGTPTPAASAAAPAVATPMIECQIHAEPRIELGQPVTVHFRLLQRSAQPVHVLTWRTPLEGLRGDDFRVVHQGAEIPYVGPTFKRGNPTAKQYRTMEPGAPLEAEVDLSLAYDFGKPGRYAVAFRGHIWDMATKESEVPRPLDRHEAVPLQCAGIEIEIVARR